MVASLHDKRPVGHATGVSVVDALLDGMVGRVLAGIVLGLLVYGLGKVNDHWWGF